jgi:uncharacterized protein YneF (UPF0154 family)
MWTWVLLPFWLDRLQLETQIIQQTGTTTTTVAVVGPTSNAVALAAAFGTIAFLLILGAIGVGIFLFLQRKKQMMALFSNPEVNQLAPVYIDMSSKRSSTSSVNFETRNDWEIKYEEITFGNLIGGGAYRDQI